MSRGTFIAAVLVACAVAPAWAAPPIISQVTVTPTSMTSVGGQQTYTVYASDPGGSVVRVMWDFGDGYRDLNVAGSGGVWTNSRTVKTTGQHAATVYVIDNVGEMTTQSVVWSASDPSRPSLTVNGGSPDTVQVVTSSSYSLSGTAGGTGVSVLVTSDRGASKAATGTTSWSANITLQPGLNRLIIQARESDGDITAVDRLVRYEPTGALAVANISQSAPFVERWKMLEITFAIQNSAATSPLTPYDPTAPGVMKDLDGMTVNGVFWRTSNPGVTYVRPAFYYQEYQYDTSKSTSFDWYMPIGSPVWKLRFSPPEQGDWQYRIEVEEAKGTAQSTVQAFTATAASATNHGPIVRAPADSRYFERADGTPWLGSGFNLENSDDRQHLRWNLNQLNAMGSGNENFVRYWLAGDIWGSNWNPWPSVDIGLNGNPPNTGLTLYSGYGDSIASMRLNSNNRVVLQGWNREKGAVKPGTRYRLRMRVRTEGITGPINASYPYGLTVKSTGWPYDTSGNPITYSTAAIIPHVYKDTPWHVQEVTFTTTSSQWFVANSANFFSILLENTTGGTAWVDSIELNEVDASGNVLSQQILRGSRMSFIQQYDLNRAWHYDQIFQRGQELDFGFMLCVSEKQDFLLSNLDSTGLPRDGANSFWANPGNASNLYQRYYWRYLMARYGAYQSIFGWEHVNEADPNSYRTYDRANELALLAAADGNPHFGGTSTWTATGSWATYYKDPSKKDIGWVDGHRYENVYDFADFYNNWSMNWYGRGFNKPIIAGELGSNIDYDLAGDTDGTWLHNFMWAHTGPGGLYTLYWYQQNTFNRNLHYIFGNWRRFMADIPITNGHYRSLSATVSNTTLRVYGQKDIVQDDRAHMWVQNKNHTWQAGTVTPVSGAVTFTMGQPNMQYNVRWYNTATGQVSSTSTVTSNIDGVVSIAISNLSTDTALKLVASTPPHPRPEGVVDKYLTAYGQGFFIDAAAGVLANDTNPNEGTLSVTRVLTNASHGQLSVTANGSFVYVPDAGYYGTDQFRYELTDGTGEYGSGWAYIGVSPGAVSNDGLVAYVSMNEHSGTLAFDASPHGGENSGTLMNGANWAPGAFGNGVALDGSDDYVQIPASPDINEGICSQRTVSVWFRVNNKSLTTIRQVIYEEGDSTRGLSMYVYNNRLYVGGWNNDPAQSNWTGTWLNTLAIENNTWHMASLTLNGTATVQSNALIAYLDGVEFARGSGSQLWEHLDNNAVGHYDGTTRFHTGTSSGGPLAGAVDELRIYSRVLTPGEMALLYGNHAPDAVNDSVSTPQNEPVQIAVLANDTDPDEGDILRIYSITQPSHGTAQISGAYVLYTPALNWRGTDIFTYTVTDDNGKFDTATVTVIVYDPNGSPWEEADIGNVLALGSCEETDGTWTIEGNGVDIWGSADSFHYVYQALVGDGEIIARVESVEATNGAAKGGVMIRESLNANSKNAFVCMTPSSGVSFQYRLTTGATTGRSRNTGITLPRWVRLVRTGDQFRGYYSSDGVNWTQQGTVQTISMGSPTTPIYIGLAVTARVSTSELCTAVFTNVTGLGGGNVNRAPVANDDVAETDEDTPVQIPVLANDTDEDPGDTLSISGVTQGAHGTVVINGSAVTYTPAPNWNGVDHFTYTVSDGRGGTDTGNVQVTVHPVNDDPVANDDTAETGQDQPVVIDVLANDTDVDIGDTLSVYSVTQGGHGSVSTDGATVTYTPNPGWYGIDVFHYRATDGQAVSEPATVTVTVHDTSGPVITDTQVNPGKTQRSTIQILSIVTSEPVQVAAGALTLHNDTTGEDFDVAAVPFDPGVNEWNLSGVALTNGYYTATVAAAGVTDLSGNPMAENCIIEFHRLAGDATGDALVNVMDLLKVQQNYLKPPDDPSLDVNADVNGDGQVNVLDLLMVRQNYLLSLTQPQAEPVEQAPSTAETPVADEPYEHDTADGPAAEDPAAAEFPYEAYPDDNIEDADGPPDGDGAEAEEGAFPARPDEPDEEETWLDPVGLYGTWGR